MAMLQSIRNRAIALAIIIGVAMISFIIGDFLNSGSSLFRQSQEKIAKIGGYDLNYKDYDARISELENVYKIQSGQTSLSEKLTGQIRESVFQSIVREKLLDDEAEKLGVYVTAKELFDMVDGRNINPLVQQLPIFQNPKTGKFDRTILTNFLKTISSDDLSMYSEDAQEQIRNLKAYWLFFERTLKYSRLEEKINTILTATVRANSIDAKAAYNNSAEKVSFQYVNKSYFSYQDSSISVSDKELEKRYKQEKEKFAQEPYRSAGYVLVNVYPDREDSVSVTKKVEDMMDTFRSTDEISSFVNSNSDLSYYDCYYANSSFKGVLSSFIADAKAGDVMEPVWDGNYYEAARLISKGYAPDSVRAYRLVIPANQQERADSIVGALKKGSDFSKVVASVAPAQAQSFDMGWFKESDAISLGSDFVSKCFSSRKGAVLTFSVNNSISILKIVDQTRKVKKTKIALLAMQIIPSSKTYSAAYNKLNSIVASSSNADDFFSAASGAGYHVRNLKFVHKNDYTIAQLPQMRQAVRFIFNNDVNAISGILENSSNQFVVVGITGVSDGEYASRDDVSYILSNEIINEKKADKIIAKAGDVASLDKIAAMFSLSVKNSELEGFSSRRISGIGDEPKLAAALSTAKEGQTGSVAGKSGVYFYKVVSKSGSGEKFDLNKEKNLWNGENGYRIKYRAYETLKKAYGIEDNRIRFY